MRPIPHTKLFAPEIDDYDSMVELLSASDSDSDVENKTKSAITTTTPVTTVSQPAAIIQQPTESRPAERSRPTTTDSRTINNMMIDQRIATVESKHIPLPAPVINRIEAAQLDRTVTLVVNETMSSFVPTKSELALQDPMYTHKDPFHINRISRNYTEDSTDISIQLQAPRDINTKNGYCFLSSANNRFSNNKQKPKPNQ